MRTLVRVESANCPLCMNDTRDRLLADPSVHEVRMNATAHCWEVDHDYDDTSVITDVRRRWLHAWDGADNGEVVMVTTTPERSSEPPRTPMPSCSSPCNPLTTRQPRRRTGSALRSNDLTEMQPMPDTCTHFDTVADGAPSSDGCEDLPAHRRSMVHLRLCMHRDHFGSCNNSPNRHATVHWDTNPLPTRAIAPVTQGAIA